MWKKIEDNAVDEQWSSEILVLTGSRFPESEDTKQERSWSKAFSFSVVSSRFLGFDLRLNPRSLFVVEHYLDPIILFEQKSKQFISVSIQLREDFKGFCKWTCVGLLHEAEIFSSLALIYWISSILLMMRIHGSQPEFRGISNSLDWLNWTPGTSTGPTPLLAGDIFWCTIFFFSLSFSSICFFLSFGCRYILLREDSHSSIFCTVHGLPAFFCEWQTSVDPSGAGLHFCQFFWLH